MAVPLAFIGWIVRSKGREARNNVRQSQRSGNRSTNLQAGRDVSIGPKDD